MYRRLAIFLLFVMVACIGTRVGAQQTTPATGPMPSPPSELTPRPLPPPVPPPPPQLTPPSTPPPSTPPDTSATPKLPLIAGIPYQKAMAILNRHGHDLINLPGADGVSLAPEGILVYTDNPAVVPAQVEGLPVKTAPALGWKNAEAPPGLPSSLPEPQCQPPTYLDVDAGRCVMPAPFAEKFRLPEPPPPLSPPSGVIVLQPGGKREQADVCPTGFKETVETAGWRFCVDPEHPEPIPPLWTPPIASFSFEEAEAIFWRHRDELMKVPGVSSVALGADGIHVYTIDPTAVPQSVEGLPIKTYEPRPAEFMNHTTNAPVPIDPHAAVAIRDVLVPFAFEAGTLTGVALSKGKPWLIFPTHLMEHCEFSTAPQLQCPPSSTAALSDCFPYAGTEKILETPLVSPVRVIGYVQRWDYLDQRATDPNGINPSAGMLHNSADEAAAFMDNNTVEQDGSLKATTAMESCSPPSCLWNGMEGPPSLGIPVNIVSSLDPHVFSGTIVELHRTEFARATCAEQPNGPKIYPPADDQFVLQPNLNSDGSTFCIQGGDSGSPVLERATGKIIGSLHWAEFDKAGCGLTGGGTTAARTRTLLGFDTWYGPNATDSSVQVYPAFRTVLQGQGACAWVNIKNTGTVTAQSVAIQNATTFSPQPAFNYQNQFGQWNTPSSISAGQTARFAVCLNLNQTQIPILWLLNFYGTNAAAPIYKFAYNTLATRWTATPLPDPAITTATLSNDDVVHTSGPSGTGAFSLTTVNNGASGAVTITLDTDDGDGQLLPYTLWVCETNDQAQCTTPLSPSLSLEINTSSVHTFSVFAQGQGQPVALDPYYNRIYFRIREGFNTPTGTLVGAAGLSITTN